VVLALLLLSGAGLLCSAAPSALASPQDKETAAFRSYVYTLAADSMEGRGLGSQGIRRSADWIEKRLRAIGLNPAFGKSYRQPFSVKMGVSLTPGNRIEGLADSLWTPLGASSAGDFSGELAFVGYGIESPSIGYQELSGIDLKGKVALMLRYEPQEKDEASPFDGRRPSRWSAMRYKTLQARERGAVAVIFVTGPTQDQGQNKLPALRNDGPESPVGLPLLQVRTSVAQEWLSGAGIDLKQFQESVDRDLTPHSAASTHARVSGHVALENKFVDTANLAGVLPGRGALAGEVIVVGAHYDHLGMGGEHSMRPNEVAIHNGADDNASGCAGVLLAAESLKKSLQSSKNHRTVVFVLFSGEEVGLAGSSHFVAAPPYPIDRVTAMINLDMVGRLRDNQLIALGSESAPEWAARVERAARATDLSVNAHGDGYGPSDQTSFYAAGIPVLHLFTGTHEAYHTPDDKPATVNAAGGAKVARFTAAIVADLANAPGKPVVYARLSSAPAMSGDSRGYGSYLGTVPDYRAMEATEGGVLLADVRPGGPAERAGIRGGDRIVAIAGTRIENLYDMSYALQDHKPGETVDVFVIRGGSRVSLRATLGDRNAMAAPAATPPHMGSPADSARSPGGTVSVADSARVPSGTREAKETVPSGTRTPSATDTGTVDTTAAFVLPAFYEGRPGAEFKIGAGQPFAKPFDGERHLKDIRQLTFGGENAEPYFSPDGRSLIFQATVPGAKCDQQYVMDLATGAIRRVSSGKGRTTCGYFDYPEADRIVYASTQAGGDSCPPPPDRSHGYVWAIYDSYDIWQALPDGSQATKLTDSPGYDAEATWCHRGGKLVFTSVRDGDLDLYTMDEAGAVRRLTDTPGYDGGAFYSPDCSEIVWRASRPQGAELEEYRRLLTQDLVHPSALEIWLMKADGTGAHALTSNGAANFCPTFLADGNRIIYSSNVGSESGREFDLWLIDKRGGTPPERITFAPGFDGFPHFSPDGRRMVWASNRADPESHQTNLYIARWAD
jgi:Tol biopolymer transport system component